MKQHCPICNSILSIKNIFDTLLPSSAKLYKEYLPSSEVVSFAAGYCNNCFHITNTSHDVNMITNTYTDSNYVTKKAVSVNMSQNLKDIIAYISSNMSDKKVKILEIGSGSGEIANYFYEHGHNITTVDPCIENYNNLEITHYSQFFDEQLVSGLSEKFDLIICRHIIEHTSDPVTFLKLCNSVLAESGIIYLEVPNLENTLLSNRLVDFFYDHVHHFSIASLTLCGTLSGFTYKSHRTFLNDAHFGIIFSYSKSNISNALEQSKHQLQKIIEALTSTKEIIIYGAGAHASTFVSILSPSNREKIISVVDKDIAKLGYYLPLVNIQITIPVLLNTYTGLIVNTSTLYKTEVENYIRNELQFSGELIHI